MLSFAVVSKHTHNDLKWLLLCFPVTCLYEAKFSSYTWTKTTLYNRWDAGQVSSVKPGAKELGKCVRQCWSSHHIFSVNLFGKRYVSQKHSLLKVETKCGFSCLPLPKPIHADGCWCEERVYSSAGHLGRWGTLDPKSISPSQCRQRFL